jgi:hypothetical protein
LSEILDRSLNRAVAVYWQVIRTTIADRVQLDRGKQTDEIEEYNPEPSDDRRDGDRLADDERPCEGNDDDQYLRKRQQLHTGDGDDPWETGCR